MNGSILKITGLTPQLEMEIADLLDEAALLSRCVESGDLFATLDADEKIVGLACAERYGENCLIHFVVVRPESRMKGTGSALVNHVLGYFAGRCDRAYAAVGDAGRFFERFGFIHVPAGELPAVFIRVGSAAAAGPAAAGTVPADRTVEEGVMMLKLPSRWTIP